MKGKMLALLLLVVQLGILGGLAGKYWYDRQTRPRFWVKTEPVDPELPVRGRYVALRVSLPADGFQPPALTPQQTEDPKSRPESYRVRLRMVPYGQKLMAEVEPAKYSDYNPDGHYGRIAAATGPAWQVTLDEPVLFFFPEKAKDPSRLQPGEELWVEATLPRKGPLRPLRLGIKKEGILKPLSD